jgi:hypothetical protein
MMRERERGKKISGISCKERVKNENPYFACDGEGKKFAME